MKINLGQKLMRASIIYVICGGLFFSACKRDRFTCSDEPDGCPVDNSNNLDLLPPNAVRYLDSFSTLTGLNLDSIQLPNGEMITDYMKQHDSVFYKNWQSDVPYEGDSFNINTFIARTTFIASKFADGVSFQYPSEGANKPAQNGLAYVYGSKDFSTRRSATSSHAPNVTCDEQLYGIDASGLTHYIFEKNDLEVSMDPVDQVNTQKLQELLTLKYPWSDYRQVDEMYAASVGISGLQAGDIIYWRFSPEIPVGSAPLEKHVGLLGIVIKNQWGEPGIVLSYGTGYGDCENNYNSSTNPLKRGPKVIALANNPYAPGLIEGFLGFDAGGRPSSSPNAPYVTFASSSIVRIEPVYFGEVSNSQQAYYGGSPYCDYYGEMQNVRLSMNQFYPNPVNSALYFTFIETAPGCPYAPADPVSYYYTGSIDFSSGYLFSTYDPYGGQGPYCYFSGVLSGGSIYGGLYFQQYNSPDPLLNWYLSVPITLTIK